MTASSPAAPPRGRGYLARRRRTGIYLVLPALAVLAIILAAPIATSFALSFMAADTADFHFGDWVGLANYQALLADPVFALAVRNSLYWMGMEVAVVVAASLGFALLLNHPLGRPAIFRVILLVPWALAPVANAILWKWIYNSNYGILNFLGTATGLLPQPVIWLAGDPAVALNSLLVAEIWKEIPFITLLLLAGLQNVPKILYRASRLDGAGPWQTFRYVTLPQMRSTILICIVLQSIWALKSFDLVYVLTRGGPANSTTMLNFLAYRFSFQFGDLGLGAAVADILFLIMFVLALAYLRVFKPTHAAAGATA